MKIHITAVKYLTGKIRDKEFRWAYHAKEVNKDFSIPKQHYDYISTEKYEFLVDIDPGIKLKTEERQQAYLDGLEEALHASHCIVLANNKDIQKAGCESTKKLQDKEKVHCSSHLFYHADLSDSFSTFSLESYRQKKGM